MEPLYQSCDLYVEWLGASDSADDSYLNSATVTFQLYTAAGVAVSGGSGTCTYVAASNGNYRGILDSAITATLTVGSKYYIVISLDQGSYEDVRTLWYRCQKRGAN